jgi:hypothetical protein
MGKHRRRLVFALSVLATPLTGAFAQDTTPATTNFQGATAAPTPGDKAPASAATGASKTTPPGVMGTIPIPGSNDMVAHDQPEAADTKTGDTGTGRSSGSGAGR